MALAREFRKKSVHIWRWWPAKLGKSMAVRHNLHSLIEDLAFIATGSSNNIIHPLQRAEERTQPPPQTIFLHHTLFPYHPPKPQTQNSSPQPRQSAHHSEKRGPPLSNTEHEAQMSA